MKAVKSQSISKAVVLLQILDDGTLVAINADTTVYNFNIESFKLLDGFKVGIKHARYKTKVIAYAQDAKHFASLTSTAKESILYDIQAKKIITSFERHHGEVSCVGIDPLSRFMFSCGDDGKTFALDIKSGKLVFTLPMHIDSVNDIAFTKNGNWVATASYDRKVSLFSLVSMTPKDKFERHFSPVMKLHFINSNLLLSIDKKSNALVWNINTKEIIAKLQGIHDDVTHICVNEKANLLFMGTELGYILLYELKNYTQLSQKYIKVSSMITALVFDDETGLLIIGTKDGFISSYDVYEGVDKIKELFKRKNFEAIYFEVEKNPVLQYTQIYDVVLNFWNNALEKAELALQNEDTKRANLLLKHFQTVPSKKRVIQKLLQDYENFGKFKKAVEDAKLILAYNLAYVHPIYKKSKIYKALEERWKKTVVQAQKYILEKKGLQKVQELLKPYRGISEKTKFIQEIMSKGEVYKRFKLAIGQKDFKVCFELIKHNPFLIEFPEYNALMKFADTIYIKLNQHLKDGDIHSAIKMARVLRDFPDFQMEIHKLEFDLDSKQKFFKAIDENDTMTAYNMMAISEDLLLTSEGKILHEKWNSDIAEANAFVVNGNVEGVRRTLDQYMSISSKYRSLAVIFAWTYMVQLENALDDGVSQSKIENGIKNYILNFGIQDQIENFFASFKKKFTTSKLNLELLSKGSLAMWRPSMIVNSILD